MDAALHTMTRKRKTQRGHGEGTIGQRPDGRYYAAIPLGTDPLTGKRKRRWIYGNTEKDVIRKMRQIERQKEDGILVTPAKTTVSTYAQEWLRNNQARWKPRTHELYGIEIRTYLDPTVGTVQLQKLTPLHVEAMVRHVVEHHSPNAANHARTRLYTILQSAVKHGLVPRNPVEMTAPVRVERTDRVLWTPEQIRKFLSSSRDHRLYSLFYLALTTGMRRGELLGLKWTDVQDNVITVKRTLVESAKGVLTFNEPKTHKGWRQIPVNDDTLRVLLERRKMYFLEEGATEPKDWVGMGLMFGTDRDKPIAPSNLDRDWKAAIDGAGLPRITLHALRHTHATMLIVAGIDVRHLADRLGHARPSFTLDRYAHVYAAQREKAALSLDQLLAGNTTVRATDRVTSGDVDRPSVTGEGRKTPV